MEKIELTHEDAELFKLFCKHRQKFEMLNESGLFDVRGGAAIIHFDANGNIRKTEIPIIKVFKVSLLK